ncbi:MAG: sugar-binding protein [bacterium]
MKKTIRISGICGVIGITLLIGCVHDDKAPALPNPPPIFKAQDVGRTDPILRLVEFPDEDKGMTVRPIYQVGHKCVTTRISGNRQMKAQAQLVKIYAADKELCSLTWWGSLKDLGCGWPFAPLLNDPDSLTINAKTGVTTYTKPYKTEDGQRAVFTYTLRPLGDSKVELTWSTGSRHGVGLWACFSNLYRGKKITIGGAEMIQHSREELTNNVAKMQSFSGDFVFDANDPINGFKLEMGDLSGGNSEGVAVHDKGQSVHYSASYRTGSKSDPTRGRIVIDLGQVELPSATLPPPVGGIDFWKDDATHVPLPPTRNVMVNPSFEQGLRFWTWIGGGAKYTPTNRPKYEVVQEGLFGPSALKINPVQMQSPGIHTLPMSLNKGKTYTLSFYARLVEKGKRGGLSVALSNAARGGTISSAPWGDVENKASHFQITDQWVRYHRVFVADAAGLKVNLSSGQETLVDGLQLEEGNQPTEFVCSPIEGNFVTANPDNDLHPGKPMNAGFIFVGKPNTHGDVIVTIRNPFREILYTVTLPVTIGTAGKQVVKLPLTAIQFGTGVFAVQTEYRVSGVKPYYEFYRFSLMKPLDNTQPTHKLIGTLVGDCYRVSRGEDLARKYMEWGWGGTSWTGLDTITGETEGRRLLKKYKIINAQTSISGYLLRDRKPEETPWWTKERDMYELEAITPEVVKYVEDKAYETLSKVDKELLPYTAYGNEEESSRYPGSGRFADYVKLQTAVGRAAHRLGIGCTPTSGTSGYSLLRGFEPYEGYLKAAHDAGFKYDALSVHPYGSIDKGSLSTSDLDEEAARLIEQGKRYGYGNETPILFTEFFNVPETLVPAWDAGPCYDAYQSGKPTYDFGNREFVQASSAMRLYMICMKYWPRVQCANIWVSQPFMDLHLTPIVLCKAVNTLGHLMGDIAFTEDIRPAAGIRGYAFRLPDGTGLAPIWTTQADVENGLRKCPVLAVKFGQPVEFVDFMGNPRSASTDKAGYTKVVLTPAPLFIKAKDVKKLAKALQQAEPDDSASSLTVSFEPRLDGTITAKIKNLTGRKQKGVLEVSGHKLPYTLPPTGEATLAIPTSDNGSSGNTMHRWDVVYRLTPENGESLAGEWRMDYFYVAHTEGPPSWETIPAIAMTNRNLGKGASSNPKPGDHDASFKMAWDKNNLYLRLEVTDDTILVFPDRWAKPQAEQRLWEYDGALEVYLDTGANGRSNPSKTFDNDDYRYDFAPPKDAKTGAGVVRRFREVYHQLADGVNMATKEEAARKIACDYRRTGKGFVMTVTFAQRYIEPIVLKPGFLFGCGLYVHDHDADNWQNVKGLSTSTELGLPCDGHPERWPLMLLKP